LPDQIHGFRFGTFQPFSSDVKNTFTLGNWFSILSANLLGDAIDGKGDPRGPNHINHRVSLSLYIYTYIYMQFYLYKQVSKRGLAFSSNSLLGYAILNIYIYIYIYLFIYLFIYLLIWKRDPMGLKDTSQWEQFQNPPQHDMWDINGSKDEEAIPCYYSLGLFPTFFHQWCERYSIP